MVRHRYLYSSSSGNRNSWSLNSPKAAKIFTPVQYIIEAATLEKKVEKERIPLQSRILSTCRPPHQVLVVVTEEKLKIKVLAASRQIDVRTDGHE